MFITVKTENGQLYLNPAHIAAIEELQGEGWSIRIDGIDYTIDQEQALSLIAKLGDSAPKVETNSLTLAVITTIQRDETKNNQRPMWRCKTDRNEKVNIFLNVDEPAKDNFHLFEQAGWAKFLNELDLYSEIDCSILIAMRKDGQWWEIVNVRPYIASDMPF